MKLINAGWSSPVARQAHNLKVVGSNPTPATNNFSQKSAIYSLVTLRYRVLQDNLCIQLHYIRKRYIPSLSV